MKIIGRRDLLRSGGAIAAAGMMPATLVQIAPLPAAQPFTFAVLSDSGIEHLGGGRFAGDAESRLRRAIAGINALSPRPDFTLHAGDLARLGTRAALDHGAHLLGALRGPLHAVVGEHDYHLDGGEHWSALFGPQWYSFDHKGVHFVVLNSVLVEDRSALRWSSPAQRMLAIAGLGDPATPPFRVGERQRAWLAADLAKRDRSTPLVVLSHAPLQKIHRGWNFWTEDAEEVQALLGRFDSVNVLHGHLRQVRRGQVGNITFSSMVGTAGPWPYALDGSRAGDCRAAGWQSVEVSAGLATLAYRLEESVTRAAGEGRALTA